MIDPNAGPGSAAVFRRLVRSRLGASLQEADDEGQIVALLDDALDELQVAGWLYRTSDSGQLRRLLPRQDPLGGRAEPRSSPETLPVGVCQPLLARLGELQETIYARAGSHDWDLLRSLPTPAELQARHERQPAPDSGIGVPTVTKGRVTGLLVVFGVGLQPAEAAEYRLLANHLATALEHAGLVSDLKGALLREQAAASELRRLEDLVAELSAGSELVVRGRRHEQVTTAAQTDMLIELGRTLPHELGQPLALISGYAELIAAGRLQDQALRDACDELVEAAHRLADLAQRLHRVINHVRRDAGVGRGTTDFERGSE